MDNLAHKEIATQNASVAAQSKLHADVFKNPDEYLSVLETNFGSLSHGHSSLTLPDLQVAVGDSTLAPQVREAAAITATHYNDLVAMKQQTTLIDDPQHALDFDDIYYIKNSVDKKIGGYAAANGFGDLVTGAVTGGTAFVGGWFLTADLGTASVATVAASLGVAGASLGVMTVGMAAATGYFAYRGVTQYSRLSGLEQVNDKQIRSWLK